MPELAKSNRILAVDPGDKRIGIAISDVSGSIASPMTTILHVSRSEDAKKIIALAEANKVNCILIGQALDEDGCLTNSAHRAQRLGEEVKSHTQIPVKYWDEAGTTAAAKKSLLEMGVPRRKRRGHHDDIAAKLILQDYLDSHNSSIEGN